jgi:MinD-like ATPase involved in chromosome partitioning or flagellar assembly
MPNPYTIRVSSYKGGVGKTTTAVNLSIILQLYGKKVLLIDTDTISPSIGFHLGFESSNIGYKQLVFGKATLREAVSVHAPTGLHVITGAINSSPRPVSDVARTRITNMVAASSYDFVIVDTRPELQTQGVLNKVSETLIITTPDMPSVTAAIKMAAALDSLSIKHTLILNRIKGRSHEISVRELAGLYSGRIGNPMPEDDLVPVSVEEHIPTYLLDKKCPFSRAIYQNAKMYLSGLPEAKDEPVPKQKRGLFSWLKGLFGRRS